MASNLAVTTTQVNRLTELVHYFNKIALGDADDDATIDGQSQPVLAKLAASFLLGMDTYATVEEGLAGAGEGGFFQVLSDVDEEYTILYQDVNGVAVEKKRYPSYALHQLVIEARDRAEAAASSAETDAGTASVARDQSVAASEASGDVKFFDTKAFADAAALVEGDIVEVFADESRDGGVARYRYESGSLVFKWQPGQRYVQAAGSADVRTQQEWSALLLQPNSSEVTANGGTDKRTLAEWMALLLNPNDATVNTATGAQTLANALEDRVIHVETVDDLASLNASTLSDGQQVDVSADGGGSFRWDLSAGEFYRVDDQNRKIGQRSASDLLSVSDGGNNLLIASFFQSNDAHYIDLHASLDGKRFSRIAALGLEGRDPSYIFISGWHLIAVTWWVPDARDCIVYRSRDLQSWESVNITLGPTPTSSDTVSNVGGSVPSDRIWAPEWVVDGEAVYLLVSIRYAADEVDINGSAVPSFRPFYSEMTDVENLSFSSPTMLNVEAGNKIDPDIYFDGSSYFMLIKDEYDKAIECHTSTAIFGAYTYVNDLPFSRQMEGPSIVELPNGDVRVYADAYQDGWTWYLDTSDAFSTYGAESSVSARGPIRHGTIRRVSLLEDPLRVAQDLLPLRVSYDSRESDFPFVNLPDGYSDLDPVDGVCYTVSGSTKARITITSNFAEEFFLLVRSASPEAGIEVLNAGGNVDIGGHAITFGHGFVSDVLIRAFKDRASGKYRLDHQGMGGVYENLRASAGSADINTGSVTWYPAYGATYETTGADTGETVINSLPSGLPHGHTFNLLVRSGSTSGTIRIKAAATTLPADIVMDGAAGWDGKLLTLRHIGSGNWAPSGY